MVSEIEEQVVGCGFHAEQKTFRPHVTLGRIKKVEDKNRFYTLLDEMPIREFQKIKVKEIILFQSILKHDGPEYRPIRTYRLK